MDVQQAARDDMAPLITPAVEKDVQHGRCSRNHSSIVVTPYSLAFLLIHVGCFAAIWTGVTADALVLGLALYVIRMFAIGAGYHRYFAHRAFHTSRVFQCVLAVLALSAAQRGILWWVAKHRQHHLHSDTDADVHSPILRGFCYAHIGWVFTSPNDATNRQLVHDLAQYKELLWLERHSYLPVAILAISTWLIAGWPGLIIGFCWSTVAAWHVTFSINSLSHLIGQRPYITGDQSRNHWLLALLTMGEGWHNNHHAYQASVRQGFRWWELDLTFYLLCGLSWLGVVWDLHIPSKAVMKGEYKLGRRVIDKVAGQLAATYPIDHVTSQVLDTLIYTPGWLGLKSKMLLDKMSADAFWAAVNLAQAPTLDQVHHYAKANLVPTPSMDEISVLTWKKVLDLVYWRLIEMATSPGEDQALVNAPRRIDACIRHDQAIEVIVSGRITG